MRFISIRPAAAAAVTCTAATRNGIQIHFLLLRLYYLFAGSTVAAVIVDSNVALTVASKLVRTCVVASLRAIILVSTEL